MNYPYAEFGSHLAQLRRARGLSQQAELAALANTTQQTVSRWENGSSRPRMKDIPLLAEILKTDSDDLFRRAGHNPKTSVATFDKLFPTEALTPESFERFCLQLIQDIYPNAKVHAAGKTGHTQDGLDIRAELSDGSSYTFQCKRVDDFGPQKVRAAIKKHTAPADKKFLLLSRVASPQARQAVAKSKKWDIWDQVDISSAIRKLSKERQVRIVDSFFRGQRLALLGETEIGPWQTADEFFSPFTTEKRQAFSHRWQLVGRQRELNALISALAKPRCDVVLLVGPGGSGKTRLARQAIEQFAADHKGALVRFLSPSEEVTAKSLDDLGDNSKVLVVDDAHDRTDLPRLLQYAATPTKQAKLLLICRPYGMGYIKWQASSYALAGPVVEDIILEPLSVEQATELATQVLKEFDGPIESAKLVAQLTYDCPLATVMGAQVLAANKNHPELIKSAELFRNTLLGKFRDVVAGEIGNKGDALLVRKLLRLLALLQPFHPEDQSVLAAVAAVEAIPSHETSRLLRLLSDAGILFKRGGQYRLSPDLLADYVIEEICVGSGGISTGYAERVFDAANAHHAGHILLNLGKLDWRLSNGDPSNSKLLNEIWGRLEPSSDYGDPYIKAVTDVAYFQPSRSLSYADKLMREGQYLRDLPNILRYAAYNLEYLPRAAELLWRLGKADNRQLNQTPSHAIRILSELAAVEPNKPIAYNKIVVEFGLSLLSRPDAWGHSYTPFDILSGILRGDGHTTEAKGAQIAFTRFGVRHEAVAPLRRAVIDAAICLLSHPDIQRAVAAADFLGVALRYPMDLALQARTAWTHEFIQTIQQLQDIVTRQAADPLVLIELGHAVSWHAHYGAAPTKPLAQQLIKSLPRSLEFRLTLALLDGHGYLLRRLDEPRRAAEWDAELRQLSEDVCATFLTGDAIRTLIEERVTHIEASKHSRSHSSFFFITHLLSASPSLAVSILEDALSNPNSVTERFAGAALGDIMGRALRQGDPFVDRLLVSGSASLQSAVAIAYVSLDLRKVPLAPRDWSLIERLLQSQYELVVLRALPIIRNVAEIDKRRAIELMMATNVTTTRIADDLFAHFADKREMPFELITENDVKILLGKLATVAQIDEYWIHNFLAQASEHHGMLTADFLMSRVDKAAEQNEWGFRPSNYGATDEVRLRFRKSPAFGIILTRISNWAKTRPDNYIFNASAAELFDSMFAPFDDELVAILQSWVDKATVEDMWVLTKILANAPQDFVFSQRDFVERFLGRAQQFGEEELDRAVSALWSSAALGLRQGTAGQPFPQDVQMKRGAEKVLVEISKFSPARALYQAILETAESNLQRSARDAEALDG